MFIRQQLVGFHISEIAHNELAGAKEVAAAELVDEFFGDRKRDRFVRRQDLRRARLALDQAEDGHGPMAELSPSERRILDQGLPQLDKYLHPPASSVRGPFCTSLLVASIRRPSVRACAAEIAKHFGTGTEEVNLSELHQAIRAFMQGKLPKDAPAITRETLGALKVFFDTGKGALCTHLGVWINGQRFEQAFPLPGDANDPALISAYEVQFKDTGFDRIYVKDQHGQLFVVLQEEGQVRINAGMRAQFGEDGNFHDSGSVVAVVDVNNSVREATLGFWAQWISRTVDGIRRAIGQSNDAEIQLAATRVATQVWTDPYYANNSNNATGPGTQPVPQANSENHNTQRDMLMWGGVAAGVGATTVGIAQALPVVGAFGGMLTLFNVFDAMRTRATQNRSPIYHAMGVTVSRSEPIR